ncbi:MAG: hypothetical protein R3190_19935 [Thermoanaerobaculia bacterium]|nr:hypothetical protein [Thermoanaerobaculia bacterium]
MRLRQVATVASELEPVVDDMCAVLGLEVAFRDPGVAEFGLTNAVMAVGDTFLEVVAPDGDDTAAGRYLDKVGGAAGYMVILQTEEEPEALRRRMSSIGVRSVWRADHEDMQGTHLHPRDVGGAILSIDRAIPSSSWRWAGPDWQSLEPSRVVSRIVGAVLSSPQPASMARKWGEVVERPPIPAANGGWELRLDDSVLRFQRAEGDRVGLTAVELAATDLEHAVGEAIERRLERRGRRIRIGGVDFVLV